VRPESPKGSFPSIQNLAADPSVKPKPAPGVGVTPGFKAKSNAHSMCAQE
jgi:hypothetical protein